MNYFAHALPFLDRPYFTAGTAVPDWLTVADRKVKLRPKHLQPPPDGCDPNAAAVVGGIEQHIRDDRHFHGTRAFAEGVLELLVLARDALDTTSGLQPHFLGHLLLEVLLDAALVAESPGKMDEYYAVLESVDPQAVEDTVNRIAPRPTDRLAVMISRFRRERILADYAEDGRLMVRLDQVMRRVKLPALPDDFAAVLPEARRLVAARRIALMEGIPG